MQASETYCTCLQIVEQLVEEMDSMTGRLNDTAAHLDAVTAEMGATEADLHERVHIAESTSKATAKELAASQTTLAAQASRVEATLAGLDGLVAKQVEEELMGFAQSFRCGSANLGCSAEPCLGFF